MFATYNCIEKNVHIYLLAVLELLRDGICHRIKTIHVASASSTGTNAANKVMVSDPHFVGCPPPLVRLCCMAGIKCAVVCCTSRWITNSSTQHVSRGIDRIYILLCVSISGIIPSLSMMRQIKGFVLITSCTHSLINHCIKVIWIPLMVYSVDNAVGNCNLPSHWFPSGFTKHYPSDSLKVCVGAVT